LFKFRHRLLHRESESFLGCIAIGAHAAEVVNLVATAIATGQSARMLARQSAVHPSATEVLIQVLRERFERPAFV